jgi:site-specific recombinase XerD
MAKEILSGFGVDVDAVAGWLGSYGGEDSPDDISRGLFAGEVVYKHLVRHDHAARNPVGEVERPAINRDEGTTLAFSKVQARKLLEAPAEETVAGLRDRAILSVGLQVGLRRAEIAALKVGDLHQNRGFDSLRVSRKGGRRDALAINPQTAARLRAYLEASGHGVDIDGPLFRPLKHNGKRREERRGMDPDAIDRVVRKYAGDVGLNRGYSAHSMRATFITTALENGAQLEDVQKAAGHHQTLRPPRLQSGKGGVFFRHLLIRRFGAKPDKKIVDGQAASPSSWKTPFIATRMVW